MNQQLTQLSSVIDCLRAEVNPILPIQFIAMVLTVAEQPGISMKGLMVRIRMRQGPVSRNVKILAEQYGLLYTKRIPDSRKEVAVYPTEKCVEFVEKLCGLVMPETDEGVIKRAE